MTLVQPGGLWAPDTQFLHLHSLLVGLGDPFRPAGTKVLSLSDVDGVDQTPFLDSFLKLILSKKYY